MALQPDEYLEAGCLGMRLVLFVVLMLIVLVGVILVFPLLLLLLLALPFLLI